MMNTKERVFVKKVIAVIMLIVSLFAISGCKKEPSLGEKLQQSREEADKAWEEAYEAQQREKELEDALNTLKRLQDNAGR